MNIARIVTLTLCLVTLYLPVQSQTLTEEARRVQEASALLAAGNSDAAWEMLSGIDTEQAQLFKAKIKYLQGDLQDAEIRLKSLSDTAYPALRDEVDHTLALIYFHQSEYAAALETTAHLRNNARTAPLRREASLLHDAVLTWITPDQAGEAIKQIRDANLVMDIVREQVRSTDYATARAFWEQHRSQLRGASANELNELERAVSSQAQHTAYSRTRVAGVPDGVIYNIGIILPDAPARSDLFAVAKSIYTGIHVGAEQYNTSHSNRRIRIHLFKLLQDLSNVPAVTAWADSVNAHILIGPLTSTSVHEVGRRFARKSIPLIAPLANDPALIGVYDHLYQLNPGIRERAEAMADFGVAHQKFSTFAVLIDQDDEARVEAEAFSKRIEELGGTIVYRFDKNYARFPDLLDTDLMQLTTDPVLIDSLALEPVDALYLALGPDRAESLFQSSITALDMAASRVTLLGNQTLGLLDIPDRVKRDYQVYTLSPYEENPVSTAVRNFNADFTRYAGYEGDTFSLLAYDILGFITALANKYPNPSSWGAHIAAFPEYRGTIAPVQFGEGRVNNRLYFYKLTENSKIRIDMR